MSIDVDLRGKERTTSNTAERDRIARLVLETLKPSAPLLVETPSGGLRIVVAIPESDIADLLDWDVGAMSRVFGAAGLTVGCDGDVELYPHRARRERLLLGVNMPELDPETFQRVEESPSASDERAFAEYLERRMRRFEELAHSPDAALLGRVKCAGTNLQPASPPAPPSCTVGADDSMQTERAPLFAAGDELLTQGLSRPSSRYVSEWLVAKILVRDPLAPTKYGSAPHDGTVAGIARALAEWLAFAANGRSKEWRDSVRANHGDVDRAIASWQARYMAGAEIENSLIHRARRAAAARGPEYAESLAWSGAPISEEAWREIHAASTSSQLDGAGRFRFGVWSICLLTAATSIARYHLRRGRSVSLMLDGRHWLRVPICTRWMASWPGGSGIRGGQGERSYQQYLQAAAERRLVQRYALAPATKAVRSALAVDGETESLPADEYLVMPLIECQATRYSMHELATVAGAMPYRNGRPFHAMEVQHLLFLQDAGVRWGHEFGHATGHRLQRQADRARGAIEDLRAHETPRDDARPPECEVRPVDASTIAGDDGASCPDAA